MGLVTPLVGGLHQRQAVTNDVASLDLMVGEVAEYNSVRVNTLRRSYER